MVVNYRKMGRLLGMILVLAIAAMMLISISGYPVTGAFGAEKKLPIYCVDTKDKKVAISFDASWGNEHTEPILDILDQYKIKSTFFLVSMWVDKYPEDVKEIKARGHEIGNHSSTHPDMTKLSKEQMVQELTSMEAKVEKLTGEKPSLFRPPFGAYSNNVLEACEEKDYHVIQWDVDSLDWKNISADEIVRRVTEKVKPGSIVLFHNNAEHVEEYLPIILEALQKDGYQIVPIGTLIYQEDYHMDHTGMQVPNRVKGQ